MQTTVRKYREAIGQIADDSSSMYGTLSSSIRMKSNFAIGTAGIFFLYAVAKQKKWIPYTFIGLVLGAGIGWLVEEYKDELNSINQ